MKDIKEIAQFIFDAVQTASNLAYVDGVRTKPSAPNAETLDELYKTTRTKHFDDEMKFKIMLGNFFLSSENYEKYYKKALVVLGQK